MNFAHQITQLHILLRARRSTSATIRPADEIVFVACETVLNADEKVSDAREKVSNGHGKVSNARESVSDLNDLFAEATFRQPIRRQNVLLSNKFSRNLVTSAPAGDPFSPFPRTSRSLIPSFPRGRESSARRWSLDSRLRGNDGTAKHYGRLRGITN